MASVVTYDLTFKNLVASITYVPVLLLPLHSRRTKWTCRSARLYLAADNKGQTVKKLGLPLPINVGISSLVMSLAKRPHFAHRFVVVDVDTILVK